MSIPPVQIHDIINQARAEQRTVLSPKECAVVASAYGIPIADQRVTGNVDEAVEVAKEFGFPIVIKVVSHDILHKSDVGGVVIDIQDEEALRLAYAEMADAVRTREPTAKIDGILVQKHIADGVEVIIGGVCDPVFGKLSAFGLGGVNVEIFQDITFRLAPTDANEAMQMLADVRTSALLEGTRGQAAVDKTALSRVITAASRLISDFSEINELDLNPVMATNDGATVVDMRVLLDFEITPETREISQEEILAAMTRIMKPRGVAVIGASAEDGKIGNSVMRNLIDGGYQGGLYPVHPKATQILDHTCYASVKDIPAEVDIAVFCIPAAFVAGVIKECGDKGVAGAILIPSGFAEIGESELQDEVVTAAQEAGVRLMGPNIYGFYYTHHDLCATFCTPYSERGSVALSSQSGGVGMAIIGFSRTANMGVSAIVGLGNKADIDEDDLLTYFESDNNTEVIAMHIEDIKDGRAFAAAAKRVAQKKPIVVLKAGRTALGSRAANSHTGALAGDDRVYDSIFRECGVIRAQSLNDMLEFARGLAVLPTPTGEGVLILTGAGGSGVLLSDACVDHGLQLLPMPDDLDVAFREYIPPFGAAGNPVDITGGEPPTTYQATIDLALSESRVHALILGYWHTIITPPMVFAELLIDCVERARNQGIHKPVVCSLVGDVEIERACDLLNEKHILAYPYTAEKPVAVLGAKYRWARGAGLI